MNLRIRRTWKEEEVVVSGMFGPQIEDKVIAVDTLEYSYVPGKWFPVPVVEDPKPELTQQISSIPVHTDPVSGDDALRCIRCGSTDPEVLAKQCQAGHWPGWSGSFTNCE